MQYAEEYSSKILNTQSDPSAVFEVITVGEAATVGGAESEGAAVCAIET